MKHSCFLLTKSRVNGWNQQLLQYKTPSVWSLSAKLGCGSEQGAVPMPSYGNVVKILSLCRLQLFWQWWWKFSRSFRPHGATASEDLCCVSLSLSVWWLCHFPVSCPDTCSATTTLDIRVSPPHPLTAIPSFGKDVLKGCLAIFWSLFAIAMKFGLIMINFINLRLFVLDDLKVPTNIVRWMHRESCETPDW